MENTMTTQITQAIHNISIKASAAKGYGSRLQTVKDSITSQYQWLVADYIYNGEALTNILSHWMEKSALIGEARRIAKDALTNAVKAWGQGNVSIEMNERTTGTKQRGVHLSYLTEAGKAAKDYQDSVKALAAAIKKHESALYDALALVELERQEASDTPNTSSVRNLAKEQAELAKLEQDKKVKQAEQELLRVMFA
jgi:hypothetical protein